MFPRARRNRWWLVGAGLLCGCAAAASLRLLVESDGNSEEVFSRLRAGMSQHEAVEISRTFDASSGRCSWGATADGQEFRTLHIGHSSMDDLPQPRDIESATLSALDSYGREIEVTLGPGGTVTGTRLSPGVWEYRWNKDWRALRDKPYAALIHKYRGIALGTTVALLVASAWMLRRWSMRRSLCRRMRLAR